MSRNTGSVASSDKSWLKLYAAVAVLPLALTACGGGGGGGSPTPAPAPTPTPAPSPSAALTLSASSLSTAAGGTPITLTAAVTNSTATPTWSLSGPGTLSATSGTAIIYTPPVSGSITANTTAIVSAALTGATTQTATLTVTLPTTAGLSWTNVTTTPAGNLLGVDYDDGRFVAVSDAGGALASTDGATWTSVALFSSNVQTDHLKANAVSHLGTTLVAGGSTSSAPYTTSTGVVSSSTDGVTWTAATLPAGAAPIHGFIAGARLIALSEGGVIYSSTDGRTYTALTTIPHAGAFNAGAYNGSQYVGVGDSGYVIASMNGITWGSGQVFTGINMHGVAWTGTQFVAVGDSGTISVSPDGTNWSGLKTSAISGALRSVAVSSSGLITVVGDNGIETSSDGSTWTARNASGVAALSGVAFGNGEFVAVGASSAIKTSSN